MGPPVNKESTRSKVVNFASRKIGRRAKQHSSPGEDNVDNVKGDDSGNRTRKGSITGVDKDVPTTKHASHRAKVVEDPRSQKQSGQPNYYAYMPVDITASSDQGSSKEVHSPRPLYVREEYAPSDQYRHVGQSAILDKSGSKLPAISNQQITRKPVLTHDSRQLSSSSEDCTRSDLHSGPTQTHIALTSNQSFVEQSSDKLAAYHSLSLNSSCIAEVNSDFFEPIVGTSSSSKAEADDSLDESTAEAWRSDITATMQTGSLSELNRDAGQVQIDDGYEESESVGKETERTSSPPQSYEMLDSQDDQPKSDWESYSGERGTDLEKSKEMRKMEWKKLSDKRDSTRYELYQANQELDKMKEVQKELHTFRRQLDSEVRNHKQETRNLKAALDGKDKEIQTCHRIVKGKDQELERRGLEIEWRGQEIEKRDQEIQRRGLEIEWRGQEIEKRDQEIQRRGLEIEWRGQEIEKREQMIGKYKAEVTQMRRKHLQETRNLSNSYETKLRAEAQNRLEQIQHKDEELSKLVKAKQKEVEQLNQAKAADLANLNQQHKERTRAQTAQYEAEINKLVQQNEDERANYLTAMDKQQEVYDMREAELTRSHEQQISDLTLEHEEEKELWTAETAQLTRNLNQELEELSTALIARDSDAWTAPQLSMADLGEEPDEHIAEDFEQIEQMVVNLARLEWKSSQLAWTDNLLAKLDPGCGQKKLKQSILKNLIWEALQEHIFCSPFRLFGEEGRVLEMQWNERCGSDFQLSSGNYTWPPPRIDTERWRYITVRECRLALTKVLPSEYDPLAKIKKGFKHNRDVLIEELISSLSEIAYLKSTDEEAVERMVKRMLNVWLQFGMHRCRIMISLQSSNIDSITGKGQEPAKEPPVLNISPSLGRYGNVRGFELETNTTIGKYMGETMKLA